MHQFPRMPITDIPITNLSFSAYRLVGDGGVRLEPASFLSLVHWFEAEKFRAFARELYQEALHSPSVKEVRRFSAGHQRHWRGDWLAVKQRALACGMVYAARSDPGSNRWLGTADELAHALLPLGFEERLLAAACAEYVRLRDAQSVSFLGGAAAPPDHIGKRIHAVHKKAEGYWRLAHWIGRHGSWQIHDWAIQQHVPVSYHGAASSRLATAQIARLAESTDHFIVFEQRKGKVMDRVIRQIKTIKASIELDLYASDAEGALTI